MVVKVRPIKIEGDVAIVTLTKGYEAVIDAADAAMVGQFNWCANVAGRSVYAMRKDGEKSVMLHRFLLGAAAGQEVDHEDGDGLNNRRANLRSATVSQNQCNQRLRANNTSGVKGVSWNRWRQAWQASITVNGSTFYLGYFDQIGDAAKAYAQASKRLHGEFGRVEVAC